uniref:Uncharacterized protein n=1 Tax=Solanum tuberosum TaxID=4113 RepID=M1DXE8_SOLTU
MKKLKPENRQALGDSPKGFTPPFVPFYKLKYGSRSKGAKGRATVPVGKSLKNPAINSIPPFDSRYLQNLESVKLGDRGNHWRIADHFGNHDRIRCWDPRIAAVL